MTGAREGWRYHARTIPALPPAVVTAVAVMVVALQHGQAAAFPLQVVSIALASGVGATLDDPAFEIMAASPTSLLRRRVQRFSVVGPPAVTLWALLLLWQGTAGSEETWALVAMFAGLMGLSLGIAGFATRRSSRGHGGLVVAPTLFIAVVISTTLPPRWRPLPLGDIPGGWTPIYRRWAAAAIAGVLAFLLSSRDPAVGVR